jgi:hypothetical protein
MEKCPQCGNWTVVYIPEREENICCTCNHRATIKYADYLKAENVSGSIVFPSINHYLRPVETRVIIEHP